jgi:hypothetical protein
MGGLPWAQLGAVKQDTARQQAENSQLHIRLIQEAEQHDRQEKAHYQQVKRLEDKIAELSYWKQSATEKLQLSERENVSLRRKVDGLVKLTDQLTAGVPHVTSNARCKARLPSACVYLSPPKGVMDPQAIAASVSATHTVGESNEGGVHFFAGQNQC